MNFSGNRHFEDGYYTIRNQEEKEKVFIDVEENEVLIYPSQKTNGNLVVDTTRLPKILRENISYEKTKKYVFNQPSFDIDFLTIPIKFRPKKQGIPAQLNANINGAVYLGYRTDSYYMNYNSTPLGTFKRKINHFGFSIGVFAGIGNTLMSPTNTLDAIQEEYDAIVLNQGIAGIFAVNNFTIGLALGFDHLTDKNRSSWVYQHQPWLGISVGLNLN